MRIGYEPLRLVNGSPVLWLHQSRGRSAGPPETLGASTHLVVPPERQGGSLAPAIWLSPGLGGSDGVSAVDLLAIRLVGIQCGQKVSAGSFGLSTDLGADFAVLVVGRVAFALLGASDDGVQAGANH